MNTMTREEKLTRVHTLMERERRHLRDAYRAQRDALEAEFFGDEDEVHTHLEDAYTATNAARVCAAEIDDLLGGTSDSSYLSGSNATEEGGEL